MPDFAACLRCGSPRLHVQTLGEGLIPSGSENTAWVCADCGFQGQPVVFTSLGEFAQHRDEARTRAGPSPAAGFASEVPTAPPAAATGSRPWLGLVGILAGASLFVAGLFTSAVIALETSAPILVIGGVAGVLLGAGFILAGIRLWRRPAT